jgi:hypothetical protein
MLSLVVSWNFTDDSEALTSSIIRAIRSLGLTLQGTVLWLRWIVGGLLRRRTGFEPGSIYVGFVAEKESLRQIFLPFLLRSPVDIISPWLSILMNQLGDEQ